MKPIGVTVPELDTRGDEAEAAPERRTRNGLAVEACLDAADTLFEDGAIRQNGALLRGPGADLAGPRPAGEVAVRLVGREPLDGPLDPNLFLECGPVQAQRSVRVRGQFGGRDPRG